MTEKGQMTIPAEIRRRPGLQPKERVVIEPVESVIRKNFGAVRPGQYPEGFREFCEEVEQAIAEEAVARARRD